MNNQDLIDIAVGLAEYAADVAVFVDYGKPYGYSYPYLTMHTC